MDSVYESEKAKCRELLLGKTVSLCLDGWSNVHNEGLVCSSVVLPTGATFLVDTVDTSGHSHNAEYLTEVAVNAIEKCKNDTGATVKSLVTDNAANVRKMRQNLETDESIDVVTYGCSAHQLNLLSGDLEVIGVKDKIVSVVKYFRNRQLPAAWYKQCGGMKLVLPQEVRWNTLCDSIESFLRNRGALVQVTQDHKNEIDSDIVDIVNDSGLVCSAKEYVAVMKPIAVALDRCQRNDTTIAVAVEVWERLARELQHQSNDVCYHFKKRLDMALGPVHYLANIFDHRFRGSHLTDQQKNDAYMFLDKVDPRLTSVALAVQSGGDPFPSYLFRDSMKTVLPQTWWKVALSSLDGSYQEVKKALKSLSDQLLSATASTAGLERIFSSFGLVQSKLRNKLGNEKAAKLTFLFKAMNQAEKGVKVSWFLDENETTPDSSTETESALSGEYHVITIVYHITDSL